MSGTVLYFRCPRDLKLQSRSSNQYEWVKLNELLIMQRVNKTKNEKTKNKLKFIYMFGSCKEWMSSFSVCRNVNIKAIYLPWKVYPPPPPHPQNEKQHYMHNLVPVFNNPTKLELDHSSGAVWESRWPSWAVRPNKPSGFCGRKDLLNHASALVSACP